MINSRRVAHAIPKSFSRLALDVPRLPRPGVWFTRLSVNRFQPFVIDDFGTGYSSLAYLNRFAVDVLKIDRSFVDTLGEGNERLDLVRNILRLAADLGLSVVAEGVETPEQRQFLADLDCEFMQGYHLCRPASAETIWRDLRPHA